MCRNRGVYWFLGPSSVLITIYPHNGARYTHVPLVNIIPVFPQSDLLRSHTLTPVTPKLVIESSVYSPTSRLSGIYYRTIDSVFAIMTCFPTITYVRGLCSISAQIGSGRTNSIVLKIVLSPVDPRVASTQGSHDLYPSWGINIKHGRTAYP